MQLELQSQGESLPLDWPPGTYVVGGGRTDALAVDGLSPGLLRVTVTPGRLLVVAHGPVWLRGFRLKPGRPCWLLPGESVDLERRGKVRLGHAGQPAVLGTRSLLRRLLASLRVPADIAVPRFLCVSGDDLGRPLLLRPGTQELGRAPRCALRLGDPAVSRRHLSLTLEGGTATVEDLGTPGGMRVNGQSLRGPRVLLPGDLVGVGRTLLAYAAPQVPDAKGVRRSAPSGRRLVAAFALGTLLAGAALAALYRPAPARAQGRSGASPARSTSSATSRR